MDKSLEIYNLPVVNHEELENVNRQMNSKEIETVIKPSTKVKVGDQMTSLVNSTKHSKLKYLSFSNSSTKLKKR